MSLLHFGKVLAGTPVSGGGGGGTPEFSQDFEAYSNGAALTTTGLSRTSGVVDTTHASNGTKGAKHSMTLGSDMDQQYGCARSLTTPLTEGQEFWVQSRFFYPTGWDFGNNGDAGLGGAAPRSKFYRLHTRTSGGTNKGYCDLYLWEEDSSTTRWNWIKEQNDAWAFSGLDGFAPGRPAAPNTTIVRNQFCKIEYYIKLHATAGQGIVRCWVDNVLQFNITDLATLTTSTDVADEWQFCTYYNGGAPATQDMWTDQWLVYTSASPPTNTDGSGYTYIG